MNKCAQCLSEVFDLPQYAEDGEKQRLKEVVDIQKVICDGCLRLFEGIFTEEEIDCIINNND